MQSYSEDMSGGDVIRKAGSTQPYPTSGGSDRNPGQGTGRVDTVGLGRETPIIIKTGATNNGGLTGNSVAPRADGRRGSGPAGSRYANS